MMNVNGFVKCIFNEVFELTQEFKGVYTNELPLIQVVNYCDVFSAGDNNEQGGYTTGCYIRGNKTVYLFKDVINTLLNTYDDIDEELYIVNVLSHELTHHLQYLNNESFDMNTDYLNRPHEIEAREISELVTLKYADIYDL